MLDKIIIRGQGSRYDSLDTCNVQLTFECVEYSAMELSCEDYQNHCVLHRVHIIPTTATDFMIECPLDDDEVRLHFEALLTANCHGFPAHTYCEATA